jgi:hypothetical protein
MYEQAAASISLDRYRRPALLVALAGLVLALLGAWLDRTQFWRSYLLAYLFWLQIGLGSLALVMLHHLAGGRWSARIRRIMETGALTLLPLAVLFVPIMVGLPALYPWADAEHILHSPLLQQKAAYLNAPFFVGRAALYFAVWLILALLLHRWSLAQDRGDDPALTARMRRLSAAGMILYMLTATFAAFDWMMSLEPEWFSSGYGLLVISGQGLAGLALAIIGLRLLAAATGAGADWTQSFNHLGNLLLGFVMIWAYLAFSQFLIIWSANLPEEAIWYARRSQGGWLELALVLIGIHFALPFFLLLSRRIKRRAQALTVLAVIILLARWLDLAWLILPAFYPDGLHLHWLDLALLLALGGAWLAAFTWYWAGKAPLPRNDPHLLGLDQAAAPAQPISHA